MADKSDIEWTEATWNPVAGCEPISPGCLNCYAARMALRLQAMGGGAQRKYAGTASKTGSGRPVFTGVVNVDSTALDIPRRWRAPRVVFVNSMSDLFHDAVPDSFVHQVFDVMNECKRHTFQVLTKRPERALAMSRKLAWSPNIWLGTSVESAAYMHRIETLAATGAHTKFLSCEPLIGPLRDLPLAGVDWVIVGGESGPRSRPMESDWVLDILSQCQEAKVAFFFKQWGGTNKGKTGRELLGRTWDELPVTA